MTLEELKAEAKRQGYNLVKAYERKVPIEPCPICGKKPVKSKTLIPCQCYRYTLECGHEGKPFYIGDRQVHASACVNLYDIFKRVKMPKTIEISYYNPYAKPHLNQLIGQRRDEVITLDNGLTKVELDKMLREAWNKNVEDIKSRMEEFKNGRTDDDV